LQSNTTAGEVHCATHAPEATCHGQRASKLELRFASKVDGQRAHCPAAPLISAVNLKNARLRSLLIVQFTGMH
jgi:hypothetical protein